MSDQHFGVVVPGRPVFINFRSLDGLKFVTEVEYPAPVTDLTFFLLPSCVLPPGSGVVLYYSLPPFQEWSVMGALTADKPSGVFRTGWSAIEGIQTCPVIQLGVSIESLDVIANLQLQASGVEERRHFAHRIALDLFRFMTSFSTSSGSAEMMCVPANIFDKWMQRFEDKFRRDPSFMLKVGGSQEG